jgi:hypothetical protein
MPAICGARLREFERNRLVFAHHGEPGIYASGATCPCPPEPGKKRCRLHGGANTGAKTASGMRAQIQGMVKGRRKWAAKLTAAGVPLPNSRKGCPNRSPEERELRARIMKVRADKRLAHERHDLRKVRELESGLSLLTFQLSLCLIQKRQRLDAGQADIAIVHPVKRGHACLSPRRCIWDIAAPLCRCDPIARARGASLTAALRKAERQSRALS